MRPETEHICRPECRPDAHVASLPDAAVVFIIECECGEVASGQYYDTEAGRSNHLKLLRVGRWRLAGRQHTERLSDGADGRMRFLTDYGAGCLCGKCRDARIAQLSRDLVALGNANQLGACCGHLESAHSGVLSPDDGNGIGCRVCHEQAEAKCEGSCAYRCLHEFIPNMKLKEVSK